MALLMVVADPKRAFRGLLFAERATSAGRLEMHTYGPDSPRCAYGN